VNASRCMILALAIHSGLYYARGGAEYFRRNFAPTLIRLPTQWWPSVNILALAATVALLAIGNHRATLALAALSLALWASIQSLRISNHIFLAWLLIVGWSVWDACPGGWSIAILGVMYSLVVVAALLSAVPLSEPAGVQTVIILGCALLSSVTLALFATPWTFLKRATGRCVSAVGGFAYGWIASSLYLVGGLPQRASAAQILSASAVGLCLIALVATGYKTEWSFTMFSNLRPFGWSHMLIPEPKWRANYYFLLPTDGLIDASTALPKEVRTLLRLPGTLYHEGLVAAIQEWAISQGVGVAVLSPIVSATGELRPASLSEGVKQFKPVLLPPYLDSDPDKPYFG
jgi:hypothetical protein